MNSPAVQTAVDNISSGASPMPVNPGYDTVFNNARDYFLSQGGDPKQVADYVTLHPERDTMTVAKDATNWYTDPGRADNNAPSGTDRSTNAINYFTNRPNNTNAPNAAPPPNTGNPADRVPVKATPTNQPGPGPNKQAPKTDGGGKPKLDYDPNIPYGDPNKSYPVTPPPGEQPFQGTNNIKSTVGGRGTVGSYTNQTPGQIKNYNDVVNDPARIASVNQKNSDLIAAGYDPFGEGIMGSGETPEQTSRRTTEEYAVKNPLPPVKPVVPKPVAPVPVAPPPPESWDAYKARMKPAAPITPPPSAGRNTTYNPVI